MHIYIKMIYLNTYKIGNFINHRAYPGTQNLKESGCRQIKFKIKLSASPTPIPFPCPVFRFLRS